MRVALATICYNEERFIKPFLQHIPKWVDKKLVLLSTKPWKGEPELLDKSGEIAEKMGADVIRYNWKTEHEQRNAGQDYLSDYDWIIILDPDEFLDNEGWRAVRDYIEYEPIDDAHVIKQQRVFWKDKEVYPHEDYKQLILVRPSVRFTESRVVDAPWSEAPITLFHFSWARTDEEVWSKISHYHHANEFDTKKWFEEVWKADKKTNLHPKTPETLKALVEARIPKELERLELWPRQKKT